MNRPLQTNVHPQEHLDWLERHRESLLSFYQPRVMLPNAGYAYLDGTGGALPEQGSQLWLGARMLHVFALATLLGREGASRTVEHGLDFYVHGAGRDAQHGGFYATVGGTQPSDRKELYGQAHVILAGSSAVFAGFEEGKNLLDHALEVVERHYWVESEGACIEAYDRRFTSADGYRGQNANMHLTEAYLAAHEATGEQYLLERAVRIAHRIAGQAADPAPGAWRLPEHFNSDWEPLLDFNRGDPRHPFRPYGSQPGHWLEWAKLLMQMKGLGLDEPWLVPAATNLFHGAFRDGWHDNGGFAYTVDWDGSIVVPEKYFWEPPEGIGAAHLLHLETGDQHYRDRYAQMWDFCEAHFMDHQHGSWFPELDSDNQPISETWPGKPDLYHAFQATMYALLPADKGLGAQLATVGERRHG